MKRQFKVLRDTPELEAGCIVTKQEGANEYRARSVQLLNGKLNVGEAVFDETTVENSPEWFEEVEDQFHIESRKSGNKIHDALERFSRNKVTIGYVEELIDEEYKRINALFPIQTAEIIEKYKRYKNIK